MKPKLNHWCVLVWDDAPPTVELCVKVKGELGLSASKNTKYGTFLDPDLTDLVHTVNYDQVKAVLDLKMDMHRIYAQALEELEGKPGRANEKLVSELRRSVAGA